MLKRRIGACLLFLPALLWVGAVIRFEGLYAFLSVAMAALFHECGHLFAFSLLGLPAPRLRPVPRGVRLVAPCPLSYREECAIALGGPLANGIAFLVGLLLRRHAPALSAFGEVSLLTGLCNLAPMGDLDGERILKCLLAKWLDERCLYYTERAIAVTATAISLLGALLLLWQTGAGTYPSFLSLAALLALPCEKNKKKK